MKVTNLYQYALRAYTDGRYETLETMSKAQHCFYLVEKSRKLTKTKRKKVNNG